MSGLAKQEFYIRLSQQGSEVFADTVVRSILLSSIKEVIRDSVEALLVELSQQESVTDADLKFEIKDWLEKARNLPIDIIGVENTQKGETVDELFLDFADVVLLEGIELLFNEHHIDVSVIQELKSEQQASFADLEDVTRVLANTSAPLALLAALAFSLVSPNDIAQYYHGNLNMEAVIGSFFAELDTLTATDEELAKAANSPEMITAYLQGTNLNLDIIASKDGTVVAHFEKDGDKELSQNALALFWRMLGQEQRNEVKVAGNAFAAGKRPASLESIIDDRKDLLGG